MLDARQRVVLITGAGRGIGGACARAFARHGDFVVVTARHVEDARARLEEITQADGRGLAAPLDVSDYEAVSRLVRDVVDRFGGIDVLVNNAGTIDPIGRIEDTDPAVWARAISVNLVGAYNTVRATLPGMLERRSGVIINVSSGSAFRPLEGWSAYCSSKAGLAMLTRTIDLEYASSGIFVIGFSPGVVDTGMQGQIRASGINPVSQLPRESLADPSEPAKAMVYLAGPGRASFAGKEADVRDPALRAAAELS